MKPSATIGLLAACAIAAASLVACGGGAGITPTPVSTLGTLGVSLTDAPACGFDAVNVTISKVRVNKSASASDTDPGWTDIVVSPARKINLLNLNNGVLQDLGSATLEAGHYTQIRLVPDANASGLANSVVPTGGAEKQLITPAALQAGVRLNGEFDVAAGQKSDIVLDFDACKSVGKSALIDVIDYTLRPVVKMVPSALNGIDGYVASAAPGSHVIASAQQNGKVVSATAADPATGEFFLTRLPVGNYDVVITADDSAATVIGAVPVTSATSTTVVATRAAPISLAGSAMGWITGNVKLTPASTTAVAWVSAKQSFIAGPTVTVKYAGADLLMGGYVIDKLPMAAPQYAAYSATLPLAFAAGTTTAPGKYTVEASAEGYATQSVAGVDSTTQVQARTDFTLVP